jgi:DNA (cytosine-5)-methyltransferase 1
MYHFDLITTNAWTDIFCGAGGSATGIVAAGGEVWTAANHWELAIRTHSANHPRTDHDIADLSETDPRRYRRTPFLWASPECTNHSIAKGKRKPIQPDLFGLDATPPEEERSRATMGDVIRFTEHHKYLGLIVENVPDVRVWDQWDKWLTGMLNLGYEHEVVYLNSMFAPPTPQSRDRVYVVFWRKGNRKPNLAITPPAYCDHCAKEVQGVQSWKPRHSWRIHYLKQYIYCCPHCANQVFPWYVPGAAAIDWTLPITRIGDRDEPLKPKTIRRIQIGLAKYADFLLDVVHTPRDEGGSMVFPLTNPMRTQLGQITHGLVVSMGHKGDESRTRPTTAPLPTQTGRQELGLLVQSSYGRTKDAARPTSLPWPTQTTAQDMNLFVSPFLVKLYGNSTTEALTDPIGTQMGNRHHGLVVPYYRTGVAATTDEPISTVTGQARHGLLTPGATIAIEDCGYRTISPEEVGIAMNFPGEYIVYGNKRQRTKQYGQGVTPSTAQLLARRLMESVE